MLMFKSSTTLVVAAAAVLCLASSSTAETGADAHVNATSSSGNNSKNSSSPDSSGLENVTMTYDFTLRPGQLLFTIPYDSPVQGEPSGRFAMTSMPSFKITDAATGKDVGLDEVYNHHGVMYGQAVTDGKTGPGAVGMDAWKGIFPTTFDLPQGLVGAESYNGPIVAPEGYGFIIDENHTFGVNLHMLSNLDLAPIPGSNAAKECNEGYYGPGKGVGCSPEWNGTFVCVGDGGSFGGFCTPDASEGCNCMTNAAAAANVSAHDAGQKDAKTYRAVFEGTLTRDVDDIIPVTMIQYSAPNCPPPLGPDATEEEKNVYGMVYAGCDPDHIRDDGAIALTGHPAIRGLALHTVERNDTHPENLTVAEYVQPIDIDMVAARGHMHTGGINISLIVNGEHVCTTTPIYGTDENPDTNVGNEFGHLVAIPDCANMTTLGGEPFRINAGDSIRIESYHYVGGDDPRLPEGAGGTHHGVMSYMIIMAADPNGNWTMPPDAYETGLPRMA